MCGIVTATGVSSSTDIQNESLSAVAKKLNSNDTFVSVKAAKANSTDPPSVALRIDPVEDVDVDGAEPIYDRKAPPICCMMGVGWKGAVRRWACCSRMAPVVRERGSPMEVKSLSRVSVARCDGTWGGDGRRERGEGRGERKQNRTRIEGEERIP